MAAPVKAIAADPSTAYDYTTRGNLVAVTSNGTAILGLGNLGALASKPVMEGKAVLFKRFADVDSIDLEIATEDPEEFVNAVKYLGPSFGRINLEDIKAPECFYIEERLREAMDIPVFHDDQHGTAIIVAAGMINAIHLTGRDIKTSRLVLQRRGSGGHRLSRSHHGIVRAPGGDNHVVPRFLRVFWCDFGVGVGHGEYDRVGRHGLDHVWRERPFGRQAEEDVGVDHRLLERSQRRIDARSDFTTKRLAGLTDLVRPHLETD